ncbi:unnamed protein product [Pleuronectes platessa]|uniref:Uncharacterized protein n=1 Tax=Pleuronectes platessa TaxID=8262 RepID=A0A9N7YNR4_PLEPL|nr:unnamed protein product [Pleuronectes platessa]
MKRRRERAGDRAAAETLCVEYDVINGAISCCMERPLCHLFTGQTLKSIRVPEPLLLWPTERPVNLTGKFTFIRSSPPSPDPGAVSLFNFRLTGEQRQHEAFIIPSSTTPAHLSIQAPTGSSSSSSWRWRMEGEEAGDKSPMRHSSICLVAGQLKEEKDRGGQWKTRRVRDNKERNQARGEERGRKEERKEGGRR